MTVLRDNDEEFLIEHRKLKVPLDKEQDCIRDHHNGPTIGHPRIVRTTEHIRRNFVFPDIKQKVASYIKKCDSYNKNKALRHVKYGNL